MKQVDLGPAGIQANIEHYQARIEQQQQNLKQLHKELLMWQRIQAEHHAQEIRLSHTRG